MNEIQGRVSRRLALLGPGPADFYREACRLVEESAAGARPLATVTHLVSHLLREVDSSVRQVLIAQLTEDRPVVAAEPPEALEPGRAVSPLPVQDATAVVRRTDGAVEEDDAEEDGEGHADQVAAIVRALGLLEDGPPRRARSPDRQDRPRARQCVRRASPPRGPGGRSQGEARTRAR